MRDIKPLYIRDMKKNKKLFYYNLFKINAKVTISH